jgi:hypothetical protein
MKLCSNNGQGRGHYVNGIKKFEAWYGHSITTVRFQIVAYDYAGNNATLDGTQPYCVYQVVPEFSSFLILALFMIITLLAIIVCKKRHPST